MELNFTIKCGAILRLSDVDMGTAPSAGTGNEFPVPNHLFLSRRALAVPVSQTVVRSTGTYSWVALNTSW